MRKLNKPIFGKSTLICHMTASVSYMITKNVEMGSTDAKNLAKQQNLLFIIKTIILTKSSKPCFWFKNQRFVLVYAGCFAKKKNLQGRFSWFRIMR